ncbi:MAG: PepSY domain-containing protein [Draconibacterium sp.]
MKRTRVIKLFKKLHRWPAVVIAFIATLFAISGIVMNHRGVFSGIDVSRKLLPGNYSYTNWNQSAVRGSLELDSGTVLIYGNIGVWESTPDLAVFKDFNAGFPKGIDNRKIYSLITFRQNLYAGTHLGLYTRSITNGSWQKINLPVENIRIADLIVKDDSLLVLTRDYLLSSSDGVHFHTIQLPAPLDYERKTGLFDTFWQLHSGELFGLTGKLIVDLIGIVTIVLSVTGLLHFFFPKIIKRRKRKAKATKQYVAVKKKNLHWHNVLGYIFALFLIINTFAGIHLRPPLLIAIASKQVGIIPGTHLDNPNPWFDKLRRVYWDKARNRYIFSTSDGFYFANATLKQPLQPAPFQPPVSVMGCNVLEPLNQNQLLTGSFSGLFIWNIETGRVSDFFSGKPYQAPSGLTRPIGANMAAGLVKSENQAWWFDYNRGAISLSGKTFPEMPQQVGKASPMSLWNVSQEIHTGRIFESILGPFYILFVPLAGICLLIVLISGVIVWWMVYRKR